MPRIGGHAAAFKTDEEHLRHRGHNPVGQQQKTPAEVLQRDHRFPPKAGIGRHLCNWLVSTRLQVACQLTAGVLFASLFVVVRQMRFLESCLGVVLSLAGFALLSPHSHVGSLLMTSAVCLFTAAFTPVYAGLTASLAYACGAGQYTGTLIAFALIGFIPIAYMRAAPGSPAPGILAAILYGVILIFTIPRKPHLNDLWHIETANLMAAMCVASAALILGGTLVLPSFAGHKLQDNLSIALKGCGGRLSRFSSFIACTEDEKLHLSEPGVVLVKQSRSTESPGATQETTKNIELEPLASVKSKVLAPELWSTEEEFFHDMNRRTDPHAIRVKYNLARHVPDLHTQHIRQLLNDCRLYLLESTFEPAYFQRGPLVVPHWAAVHAGTQALLTQIGALSLLVEGGKVFQRSLLKEHCGVDPLPSVSIVLAEIAAVCSSLSEAVKHAGTPKAETCLTAIDWKELKKDLAELIAAGHNGYRHRHKDVDRSNWRTDDASLQARLMMFLISLIHGIIAAISKLEQSIPKALGLDAVPQSRRGLATSSTHRKQLLQESTFYPVRSQAVSPHSADAAIQQATDEEANSPRPDSNETNEDKDSVAIEVKDAELPAHAKSQKLSWRHLLFMTSYMEMTTGWSIYKRFKPIMWDQTLHALSSWANLKSALSSRKVQFGFKFWFACMSAFVIIVCVENNHYKKTASWRLYYSYITMVIITQEKIEAIVWKTVQRIIGTLIGGTLAYLIMLRVFIHSRGVAVDALVLTSMFVIAHRLDSRFKYTVFLTLLTLASLTYCAFVGCCKPHQDWDTWKARVLNIIVACVYATLCSWIILPWFSSDEQLRLIADAYINAVNVTEDTFLTFTKTCRAIAEDKTSEEEGDSFQKLTAALDGKVVAPIQAASLSLRTEGVFWKRGFLATPKIVYRLIDDMTDLLHHLTGLQLAVISAPEEFGESTAVIYNRFLAPLEQQSRALIADAKRLAEACHPMLESGPSAAAKEECEVHIMSIGRGRNELRRTIEAIKQKKEAGQHVNAMTSADVLRIGSYMASMSHVMDSVMLIARVIMDDHFEERENRISNAFAVDGIRRNVSHE